MGPWNTPREVDPQGIHGVLLCESGAGPTVASGIESDLCQPGGCLFDIESICAR